MAPNEGDAAVFASEPFLALALVVGGQIYACSVLAGFPFQALVNFLLAVDTRVTGFALATVLGNLIETLTVQARIRSALVDVYLTIRSWK